MKHEFEIRKDLRVHRRTFLIDVSTKENIYLTIIAAEYFEGIRKSGEHKIVISSERITGFFIDKLTKRREWFGYIMYRSTALSVNDGNFYTDFCRGGLIERFGVVPDTIYIYRLEKKNNLLTRLKNFFKWL